MNSINSSIYDIPTPLTDTLNKPESTPTFDDKPIPQFITTTGTDHAVYQISQLYTPHISNIAPNIELQQQYTELCNTLLNTLLVDPARFINRDDIQVRHHCYIDITYLNTLLIDTHTNFVGELITNPVIVINALSHAVHILCQMNNITIRHAIDNKLAPLHIHCVNIPTNNVLNIYSGDEVDNQQYTCITPLDRTDKVSNDVLVVVHGTIIRMQQSNTIIKSITYECTSCDNTINKDLYSTNDMPSSITCTSCCYSCLPMYNTMITCSVQTILIQSLYATPQSNQLSRVMVELVGDMCDTVDIGDIVTVVGMMKTKYIMNNKTRQSTMKQYVQSNTIYTGNQYNNNNESTICSIGYKYYSEYDMNEIQQIMHYMTTPQTQPQMKRIIVNSLAPYVHQQPLLKLLLLLSLYGHCTIKHSNTQLPSSKHKLNILIHGDDELVETASDLLRGVNECTMNCVLIDANSTVTNSGVVDRYDIIRGTDTIVNDAGLLTQSNNGVLCIDNINSFDNKLYTYLFNAMKQCEVNNSLSNTQFRHSIHTSIFATACNKSKSIHPSSPSKRTVSDRIKLSNEQLALFDIIIRIQDDDENAVHSDQFNVEHAFFAHGSM